MKRTKYGFGLVAACGLAAASLWPVATALREESNLQQQTDSTAQTHTAAALPDANAGLPSNAKVAFGEWAYVGPTNIAGAAQDIAVDPVNGDLYAVSREGWVFRSSDAANSWSPVHRFNTALRVVKLDIQRDATAVKGFIGVTEASIWDSSRLLRMTPDGTTTQLLTSVVKAKVVGNSIYAINDKGLWLTDDNGSYWQHPLVGVGSEELSCTDFAVEGPNVLAVCDTIDSRILVEKAIYRSVNGGAFAKVWSIPQGYWSEARRIAISRSNPSVAYFSVAGFEYGTYVFRSDDAGSNWTLRTDPQSANRFNGSTLHDFEAICSNTFVPSDTNFVLEVDPINPDIVWTGAIELYRSSDGGVNFGRASIDDRKRAYYGNLPYLPRGIRALRFDRSYNSSGNQQVYVATPRGVYGTEVAMAAAQEWSAESSCASPGGAIELLWYKRINGYTTLDIAAVDVGPGGAVLAVIGSGQVDPYWEDNPAYTKIGADGLHVASLHNPLSWKRISGLRPKQVAIDPNLGLDRIYTSRCAGALLCRWDTDPVSGAWEVTSKLVDQYDEHPIDHALFFREPSNSSRFWGDRGDAYVSRSDDAMQSWAYMGQASSQAWMSAGAVSPADPNVVLVADWGGRIYRRNDALSANSSTEWIANYSGHNWAATSIVFDPKQPQRVYATGTGYPAVLSSRDAGASWQLLEKMTEDGLPDRSVESLVVDPDNGDVLYIGTNNGLYVTYRGSSPAWHEIPTPFADTPITKLVLRKQDDGRNLLYAFTAGRGVWVVLVRAQRFDDVGFSHWAYDYTTKMLEAGITTGCGTDPLRYCPGQTVNRDQMAVFLLRAMHGGTYQPPAATGVFSDVPTSHWAAAWIERLREEGITNGCSSDPLNYCPGSPVQRDQMAVFLLRAKYGSSYQPPAATGVFADVPTNYWAAAWIEQLAREGVTSGCSSMPKNYCPSGQVTRDQMAAFLTRAFAL